MWKTLRLSCLLIGAASAACCQELERERFDFPTQNHALLSDRPEDFFMGVDREGRRDWQGGSFGFTRSPLVHEGTEIFTKFHEGTDIAPLKHDAAGVPLDEVMAMADGEVVFCEEHGASSYGNQVVLRHDWNCGPVFSRYAHLGRLSVAAGAVVKRGQVLGVLGSTGGRFAADRAHLHVEIALMMDADPKDMPATATSLSQGRFHALNMAVLNPESLLRQPYPGRLDLPAVVRALEVDLILETPAVRVPDILARHPWLAEKAVTGSPAGWRIHLTAWGFPVRFEPLAEAPARTAVTWVRPWEGLHSWHTRQILSGQGPAAELGPYGEVLLRFLVPGR